jgi:hypothetical protein
VDKPACQFSDGVANLVVMLGITKRAIRQLLSKAGLGLVLYYVRRWMPIAAFHVMNIGRSRFMDGRSEVKRWGRALVYDTFSVKGGSEIILLGHYRNLPPDSALFCRFPSGVNVAGQVVDDWPHAEEGEQVLIVRFSVPLADRRESCTRITVTAGNRTIIRLRTVDLQVQRPKRYLTVAAMMKDEGRFLTEWVEYYLLLGADHLLLYDNRSLSRSHIRRLLRSYIERGQVTLLDWDYPHQSGAPDKSWRFCQRGQMHHALHKYGDRSAWMLFVDVDEFLYPVDPEVTSLLPLLHRYDEDSTVSGLQFKMVWFGDSGHRDTPPGLVIENYTMRDVEVVANGREKCAIKPAFTQLMFIHDTKQMEPGTHMLSVPPNQFRVNHYFATSRKRTKIRKPELNAIEDRGMMRFVEILKSRVPTNNQQWQPVVNRQF